MTKDRLTNIFLIIAGVAVLTVVVFGFFKIGSPMHQRDLESDNRRVSDISTLSQEIYSFVNPAPRPGQTIPAPRSLPASPDELPQVYSPNPNDPVSGEPYEYMLREGTVYELCATFATEAKENASEPRGYYGPRTFNTHPIGRFCFTLDASKSLYETSVPYKAPIPYDASVPIPAKPIY